MTNCCRQTVPHDWPGHRESSVAKFRPRTWNRVVDAGRRAEPIAKNEPVGNYSTDTRMEELMTLERKCEGAEQAGVAIK